MKLFISLGIMFISSVAMADTSANLPTLVDGFSFEMAAGTFLDKCRLSFGDSTMDFATESPVEFSAECTNLHKKGTQVDKVYGEWDEKTHKLSTLSFQSFPDNVNAEKTFQTKLNTLISAFGKAECSDSSCDWKLADGTITLDLGSDDNSNAVVITTYQKNQ